MKPQSKATQTLVADGSVLLRKDLDFSFMDTATQFRRHIDQYNDKYRAVISEIGSNAADEVILAINEKRQIKPYEIHLPCEGTSNLMIRDYGRGMSIDQLVENVNPGKTEKDQDNVRLGGFGVGMIAPLCLADFVIKTRQNGVETIAHITQDGGTGAPSIVVSSQKQTERPDGTDVIIPMTTRERPELIRALKEFLEYMPPKLRPVLFNAENVKIDYFFDKPDITDLRKEGIPVISEPRSGGYYGNQETTFIIGWRPYTVRNLPSGALEPHRMITNLLKSPKYIFPIGYLSVSDNRETLSMDKITSERIVKHFKEIQQKIKTHYEKELREAKNIGEAFKAAEVLTAAYNPEWPKGKEGYVQFKGHGYAYLKLASVKANIYNANADYNQAVLKNIDLPSSSYELITNGNGLTCRSKNTTVNVTEYHSKYLTKNNLIPVFYYKDCKNYIQRIKYWIGVEWPGLHISSFKIRLYQGKPEYLTKTWPNCFELINVDNIDIPKIPIAKREEKAIESFREGLLSRNEDYYTPLLFVKNRSVFSYKSDDDKKGLDIKRIFYVATKSNKLYYPHYFDQNRYVSRYSNNEHDYLKSALHSLISVNALRDGDAVFYINASDRKTAGFKEAKKNGDFIDFFHYYRRVVQGTSLSIKKNNSINIIEEFESLWYEHYRQGKISDISAYFPEIEALENKRYEISRKTTHSASLAFKLYLDKTVKFKEHTDKEYKELTAECKDAVDLLKQLRYASLLEEFAKRKGRTIVPTK